MSSVTARRSSSVERANIQTPFTYTTTGIRCLVAQIPLLLLVVVHRFLFCGDNTSEDGLECTGAQPRICAKRTDADAGWGLDLVLQCRRSYGSSSSSSGGGCLKVGSKIILETAIFKLNDLFVLHGTVRNGYGFLLLRTWFGSLQIVSVGFLHVVCVQRSCCSLGELCQVETKEL